MPSRIDLLIENAAELLTLRGGSLGPFVGRRMGELGVIHKGSLAIHEGRIVAIGTGRRLRKKFESERGIDATGKVVMPGFIDPHTHIVFAGYREEEFEMRIKGVPYMELLRRGGGILKTVKETRRATESQLLKNTMKTLDIMLKHGTTTAEAKSGYGLKIEDEIKCLRVLRKADDEHQVDVTPTFLGAHAVPREFEGCVGEYVDTVVEEMLPKVKELNLAKFCDVFCEKGVFNIDQSRRILLAGSERGLTPKIHADEMAPLGGAELAAEVRAISADHLVFASEKGIKELAMASVCAVLLPCASFAQMLGKYADARGLIKRNVPVALGTDYNPSCQAVSQQLSIAVACHEMRMTPSECVAASTINAAHAIGLGQEIGSLEIGKKADIAILGVPSHRFLGYRFGVNLVEKVVKNGKLVVDNYADS